MRVAVKNHALPVFMKNRIALLLCILETIITNLSVRQFQPDINNTYIRKPICDIVLCPFDFGVLSIHFSMLCSLCVYYVAHFKRRNSRGRAKMENNRGKKDESISI